MADLGTLQSYIPFAAPAGTVPCAIDDRDGQREQAGDKPLDI